MGTASRLGTGAALGVVVAVLCVLSFGAGVLVGIELGRFNARIDVCDDDTSGRFIADPAARTLACQPTD